MHVASYARFHTAAGLVAALCVVALAGPRTARAQGGDGFLFGTPSVTLTLRGGLDQPLARSDLFAQTFEQFNLSRASFRGATVAADIALRVSQRLAIVGSGGLSTGGAGSHFRHVIDRSTDREIEQSTSFRRAPLTLGVRGYLTPPGRAIGKFAWIPARVATFVGVGGGMMYYRFRQAGDFVDFTSADSSIFSDQLLTSGWTPTAHALVGVDYSLSPTFALTGEGRYSWARGEVNQDYVGFDRIDLSGLSATVGLSVRF